MLVSKKKREEGFFYVQNISHRVFKQVKHVFVEDISASI